MLTLVIDVCSEHGITAFVKDGEILYFAGLPFGLHNSKFLVPKIEEGLKALGVDSSQIGLIAVGIGPGSYTGMRVGSMAAKSLSFAHQIPLVGVSSLEGYIPDQQGVFVAMIDAKMTGCYLMKGKKEGDTVTYSTGPEVWKIEHAGPIMEDVGVIVSPSCENLKEKFNQIYPEKCWQWQESGLDAVHFASRAGEKFQNGRYSIDGTLDLLYMRG